MLELFMIFMLALIPATSCECTPTPLLHAITGVDGSTVTSASCGKGWKVHISTEASEKYNQVRSQASAINILAEASCVREKERK